MSYYISKTLGLEGLKPSSVRLKFGDHSLVVPKGFVDDVLVKINHLSDLFDFVTLDDGEKQDGDLVFRCPFLAMIIALIDVDRGKLMLRGHGEDTLFWVTPWL